MMTMWRHWCKCANSVMALIMDFKCRRNVNIYVNNNVKALINEKSVMALYDESVKALIQMW